MMIGTLLFFFLGIQDDSQAEISRLQGEVSRLSSELDSTRAALQAETRPYCSAQIRVQGGALRVTAADVPVRANVLSMVSSSGDCLAADIRFTATYFGAGDAFVCSGNVGIPQTQYVQNVSVELRPYELESFLKWWDGATLKQQSMVCRDYQGTDMRNPSEFATSLQIYVSVFPRRGGLATSEIRLSLPRLPR
jgi:hypothetical protein